MKLLLTSTGLSNNKIANTFLQLLTKPIAQVKVIFIPTASRTAEEKKYVNASRNELITLGVNENNIRIVDLQSKVKQDDFNNIDVVYVCGGNTFYLLKQVRESELDKVIKKFVNTDMVYVGVSAGSILAGPNIDVASPFDENDVGLTELTGLNLTDIVASPHYVTDEESIIKPFAEKFKVVRITDAQAILVDGEISII